MGKKLNIVKRRLGILKMIERMIIKVISMKESIMIEVAADVIDPETVLRIEVVEEIMAGIKMIQNQVVMVVIMNQIINHLKDQVNIAMIQIPSIQRQITSIRNLQIIITQH